MESSRRMSAPWNPRTRARELDAEPRIFARSLDNATPALIARDIDHRREGPHDAFG